MNLLLSIVFACPRLVFSDLHLGLWGPVMETIIKSQDFCPVHFINKENIRVEGEIKSPITIETHINFTVSIPLAKAKAYKCVILLIAEISKTSPVALRKSTENFHRLFIKTSITSPFQKKSVAFFEDLTHVHYSEKDIAAKDLMTQAYVYNKDQHLEPKLRFFPECKPIKPRKSDSRSEFYVLSSFLPQSLKSEGFRAEREPATVQWNLNQVFFQTTLERFYDLARTSYEKFIALNIYYPIHTYNPSEIDTILKSALNFRSINSSERLKFPSIIEKEIIKCEKTVFRISTASLNAYHRNTLIFSFASQKKSS